MTLRTILTLTLMLLAAAPARAQNGSAAGTLDLYPTYQSVGVRLSYTGDANGNATARLEWRAQGAPTWNTGVNMTRITNSRWAGSVLWLTSATAYEVRAVIDDPDGGASAQGLVTTRDDRALTPTGRTWWVAPSGSDSAGGGSTTPFRTLQHAADLAQSGDEIRVRPGTYFQTLDTPRPGTPAAPIFLTADAPGVIVDGSDPAYLNRTDWRSDGGGIWSVPYVPAANRLVCVDSLQRLYKQASLVALQTNANGIAQGFAIEGGRLFVKLEDLSAPTAHVIHVARSNVGFMIDSDAWRVSGFELRYFGTGAGGAGIRLAGASECVVSSNHVHTIGGRNIYLTGAASRDLIERNLCRDPRTGWWPWAATKAHDEEQQGISHRAMRGIVIRYNTCEGTFDGIDTGGDNGVTEDIAADFDLHDNLIRHVADDALEPETVSGLNLRVWSNRADSVYSGCSISPTSSGPMYVLYNTLTNYVRGGFKFSLSNTGQVWICHNTLTSNVSGAPAVHPSGPYSNLHFRNNVLVGNGAACVSDDSGESQTGNDFDGDLIFSNYAALFRWKNLNYSTIAALRSATGFEMAGRAGDPLFVSAASGDYRLSAASPAIDSGLLLPGITRSVNGVAPDMGAWEFGSGGPDVIPPAAIIDLH
jgi:hypothetical protein